MTDLEIINILLEELEGQAAHVRVTRGFGVGHPYFEKENQSQGLGDSMYPDETEEKEENTEFKKIEVSRAFK
jgi:hypothetical protein